MPQPLARVLAVLGYPDESAAAEAAAGLLHLRPLTVEGMANDLVGASSRAALPRGAAWLFVEVGGGDRAEARGRAEDLCRAAAEGTTDHSVVAEPRDQRALWQIREDASGTATRLPGGGEAWPGWEDCAVPPARLGAYLKDFRALLREHGLRGLPYGHFGDGCIHVRIDFDLLTGDGKRRFREFSEALADTVVAHGGSLSGEHGDGLARAELLPRMYGQEMVALFDGFKDLWDPRRGLNPGVLARPDRIDAHLRFDPLPREPVDVTFGYPQDDGDFSAAVRRCVGVAKCRNTTAGTNVMCPSFRATGQEAALHARPGAAAARDARRRGRHRGLAVAGGARRTRPVPVLQGLPHRLPGRRRHGHLQGRVHAPPLRGAPPPDGALLDGPPSAVAAPGRRHPQRAAAQRGRPHRTARGSWASGSAVSLPSGRSRNCPPALSPAGGGHSPRRGRQGDGQRAVLWPDTFTNYLSPQAGSAAVRVLQDAGLSIAVPPKQVCCGLTYVSTGQLDQARAVMRRTLDRVEPALDAGLPVTVLEPPCAAALKTDLPELLGDDPRAARLAASVRTFAQTLEEFAPDWEPPRIDRPVAGQTHCHQHAVLGDAAERRLREKAGLTGELSGGCCGLAGNFGFEKGHYEVSVACAEEQLLPSVRAGEPGTEVLADGYSCRTQLRQLGGGESRHLAEVLAENL